jgi:molybdopterin/thiamine biosynthesis adenylyltransferase
MELSEPGFTDDEAEIYDRQIRLWGINTQSLLSKSRALVIGIDSFCGEVLKNCCLAGIKYITLIDNRIIDEISLKGNLLFCADDLGKKV